MLEGEDAFLQHVADRMKLTMRSEVRTLDAIYYKAGNEVLPEKKRPYPTRLEVYIEHEQGGDPEKEMYKLLMWPATLKVLIIYESPRWQQGTERKRPWLANKLTQLFEMGRKIDSQRPEGSTAEYLFLVGKAEKQEEPVTWRYLRARDGSWPEKPEKLRDYKIC